MAQKRFEPGKSGRYKVCYHGENGCWIDEVIEYDKKKEEWIGKKGNEFYKEHVTGWETTDGSILN